METLSSSVVRLFRRDLVISAIYGVFYYFFFDLASLFGLEPGGSLWFPAAGLRLALFFVYGPRLVPGIVTAELAAVTLYGRRTASPAYDEWIEILQVAPTTVIYGVATWVMVRFLRLDPRLSRSRDVALLLAGAILVPLLNSAQSRLVQILLGTMEAEEFLVSTVGFFIGDTVGILMLTPLLLAVRVGLETRRARFRGTGAKAVGPKVSELSGVLYASLRRADPGRLGLDFVLIWAALFLLHALPRWLEGLTSHVHWYTAFLPLIWIAFRHGLFGSILGTFVVDLSAAWLIYLPVTSIRYQELQILLLILSATSLLMGAVVSDQRATATQLRRHNERLRRVQGELEERQRELESKNTELESFAYTVSHDLKSPLITIRGFAGLLRQDLAEGSAERAGEDITRIETAAGTMAKLLDELLDLSRLGRVMGEKEAVDLAEVTREAVDQVAGRIAEGGVEIEIAPDLPTVSADRRRLLQLLQNLLDNAVKFSAGAPRPRIEVGWHESDGEGDGKAVVVFVRDNGRGIDLRHQDKVFGLFEKLSPSDEGTGIGLALVKRIAEEHGGRAWVESDGLGRGATFCISLPLAPDAKISN